MINLEAISRFNNEYFLLKAGLFTDPESLEHQMIETMKTINYMHDNGYCTMSNYLDMYTRLFQTYQEKLEEMVKRGEIN